MKAFDFDAVVYDGDVFCTTCLPEGTKPRDCEPIFADSEWDVAPVCTSCGEEHDYVTVLPPEPKLRSFVVTLRVTVSDDVDVPSKWDWSDALGAEIEQVSCKEIVEATPLDEQKAGASLCCDDPACPDKDGAIRAQHVAENEPTVKTDAPKSEIDPDAWKCLNCGCADTSALTLWCFDTRLYGVRREGKHYGARFVESGSGISAPTLPMTDPLKHVDNANTNEMLEGHYLFCNRCGEDTRLTDKQTEQIDWQ